jgi:hypothetical protein
VGAQLRRQLFKHSFEAKINRTLDKTES